MNAEIKLKHPAGFFPLIASKLIERLGFYGIRAFLILYMVRGPFMFSREEVGPVYDLFIGALAVSPLLGGLLGDFIMGWKWSSVTGGCLQAAGCFLMAVPQIGCMYAGMACMVLGTGLYTPNIISVIGNLYRDRQQKMDAAMMLFYLAIDLGAFLGAVVFGFLVDITSFSIGFITAGAVLLCSSLLALLTRNTAVENPVMHNEPEQEGGNRKLKLAALACCVVLIPVFWVVMRMGPDAGMLLSQGRQLEGSLYTGLPSFVAMICAIIFSIVWAFKTGSTLLRISIGLLIYALSLSLVFVGASADNLTVALILALLLQGVSEILISPLALSYISQHAPSKYRSTLTSVFLSMSGLLSWSPVFAFNGDDGTASLCFITTALLLAAAFLAFHLLLRRTSSTAPEPGKDHNEAL
ncbi:MAG: transporter [Bacteroidetes bacterium]|nr:transporter [Bacteroidota bacterium]